MSVFAMISTSGCVIETPPVIINTVCFDFKIIHPSRQDSLSRGTMEQIIAHNETWERNCAPDPNGSEAPSP